MEEEQILTVFVNKDVFLVKFWNPVHVSRLVELTEERSRDFAVLIPFLNNEMRKRK